MVVSLSALKRRKNLSLLMLQPMVFVRQYAKNRGWPAVIAWAHRLTGILLILYLCFHIYTLLFLTNPTAYDSKMKFLQFFIFVFLEWLLAIPVIFHALNGGRLILYECFGTRKSRALIRWVLVFSGVYSLFLGLMMILGTQSATPIFYWVSMLIIAFGVTYPVVIKVWPTGNSRWWKLQRTTGAFLLGMIPAHLLFMHLNPSVGHEAQVVIARMQHPFTKFVDLLLVVTVLYHAGYGLLSIAKDYLQSKGLQHVSAGLIIVLMSVLGWFGIQLTLLI